MGASVREVEMGPAGRRVADGVVTAAHPIDGGIIVQFTEGSATFLPDWLRDNCQCHECRIVQTDERRWQPWSQPVAPEAQSVSVVDGVVQIVWADGHRSAYGSA